jgi:hypothetical protein
MTTENNATLENAVKTNVRKDVVLRETKVTHDEQHAPVVLHVDTLAVVSKMFTSQSDFENESKYTRTFLHTAVLSAAKQECRRIINAWENAITKVNKLHPTMSREQAEAQLLESKKNKEIKSQVEIAVSLLKDEFKS